MDFTYPKIILFGDSLTQQAFDPSRHGVAAALANDYARKADVLNRGVSGYTSKWLLPLFHRLMAQITSSNDKIILFVIWVGTNDACLPGSPHHVPIEEFGDNLRNMINTLRELPQTKSTKIVVVTPPPTYPPQEKRSFDVTRSYVKHAMEIAEDFKQDGLVRSIDLHKRIDVEARTIVECNEVIINQGFFTDGVHLDYKSYKILHQEILTTIRDAWPEIGPENMSLTAPWWGNVPELEKSIARS